jgi:hypothetical protein
MLGPLSPPNLLLLSSLSSLLSLSYLQPPPFTTPSGLAASPPLPSRTPPGLAASSMPPWPAASPTPPWSLTPHPAAAGTGHLPDATVVPAASGRPSRRRCGRTPPGRVALRCHTDAAALLDAAAPGHHVCFKVRTAPRAKLIYRSVEVIRFDSNGKGLRSLGPLCIDPSELVLLSAHLLMLNNT